MRCLWIMFVTAVCFLFPFHPQLWFVNLKFERAPKFKPVLRVVSYVTKTSLVFKETRGHAWQEAGRELSPLVSFSLIMRNLCWQRTFLDARERNLSKSRHGQVVCGETLSIVGENSLPSFKTTSNFTLFRVAPCLKLKYKGWYRHFSALKITLL